MREGKYTKRRYKAFLVLEREERVFPVYIMRFPEGDGAEVIMRLEDDSLTDDQLLPLGENKLVLVKVDVSGGSLDIYRGTLVYRLGMQIHLKNVCFEETLQRRADVKVPMVETGYITCQEKGRKDLILPVTFVDISAGGVGFQLGQMEEGIYEGDVFQLCFTKAKAKMFLNFQICRIKENKDKTINCGGRFVSIGKWEEAEIRKYVFEVERREIVRQRQIQEFLELIEEEQNARKKEEEEENSNEEGDEESDDKNKKQKKH